MCHCTALPLSLSKFHSCLFNFLFLLSHRDVSPLLSSPFFPLSCFLRISFNPSGIKCPKRPTDRPTEGRTAAQQLSSLYLPTYLQQLAAALVYTKCRGLEGNGLSHKCTQYTLIERHTRHRKWTRYEKRHSDRLKGGP